MSDSATPSTPQAPTSICAENIALLYLLHSVPALPSRNPISSHHTHQKNYTLSISQERSLAGTLAFLSNLKDGPDYIPAVCVEEDPSAKVMKVLLAVNKARPGDGKEVLQSLKIGFERIFAVLSQVSSERNSDIEHRVFTAIVSMCSERILCRLRFTSNSRKTSRQPIKDLLQETMSSIRILEKERPQNSTHLQRSKSFVERAREVIKLIDAWMKHRTQNRLADLVEGMHHLWQIGGLHELLGTIPNRMMDPSARKNLLNIISKVARYREAARFLYRKARHFPLLRQMKVVLVRLPQTAFEKTQRVQYTPSLSSTISRVCASNNQHQNVDQVCLLLKVSEVEASDQFAKRTRKTLKDGKIHAEIQLLFYCELEPSALPPRVVCSTKDACFLCNAFILMYGKIHTPRSHGRLYPGWRLPFSPNFKRIEQRFNRELENYMRDSVATLISRRKKTVYPDPHESTLLTLPFSASTLCGVASPVAANVEDGESKEPQKLDDVEKESEPALSSSSVSLSETSESTSTDTPAVESCDSSTQQSNEIPSTPLPAITSFYGTPLYNRSVDNYLVSEGEILTERLQAEHSSPLYSLGNLELQLEYSTGLTRTTASSYSNHLSYRIDRLTCNEAQKELEQQASALFRADEMNGEVLIEEKDMGCFYITTEESTVKICLKPRDMDMSRVL